ncbi:MAG: LemA family protein [Deltaproteobacteria bacterium]|jgi:LemA protein|nr:LemA family protein [Deltaproteobacteria bacterium]
MGSLILFLLTLALILFILAIVLLVVYNRLVVLKNRYTNAFSQIDVQLKRRYDLIPSLVESTRAYLGHERITLETVINARNAASGARLSTNGDPTQVPALMLLGQADTALSSALTQLRAVIESYPDLKADRTVANLTEDLRSTENRISFARQAYNDAVMSYNQAREMFPAVLFSSVFGFGPAGLWKINPSETITPSTTPLKRLELDDR